jgi:arabinogalactan oligomer/maltooligosaccharide transport system permease protein
LDAFEATSQLAMLLIFMVGLIALVEGILYVWVYHYRSIGFWPFSLALAIGAGLGLGLLLGSSDGESLELFSRFHWGYGITGVSVMLVLGSMFRFGIKGRYGIPFLMVTPAILFVALLVVFPFFFELRLAFANLNLYTIGRWLQGAPLGMAGFENFINVFASSPLQTATFWELLFRTIVWTVINISFHVAFGLGLAILLNRPIRGRAIYRTILIIPWAMPQVVAVLAWRGEFHPQFGMVNQLLSALSLPTYNWWSDPIPIFVSCCIVNIWLGIPFMMIVFLGGLQSIPKSLYEAAQIDGASSVKQFFEITMPMLKPVVVPSITLGTIWTFNNINVIYLMTGQDGGNESADILISALYKSAFTYSRYSFSAAFALVIFAILMGLTVFWMRVSGGTSSGVAR